MGGTCTLGFCILPILTVGNLLHKEATQCIRFAWNQRLKKKKKNRTQTTGTFSHPVLGFGSQDDASSRRTWYFFAGSFRGRNNRQKAAGRKEPAENTRLLLNSTIVHPQILTGSKTRGTGVKCATLCARTISDFLYR